MSSIAQAFQAGGFGMYVILLMAMLGTGVGLTGVVVTLVSRSRGTAAVFTLINGGLTLATCVLGVVFYLWGMTRVNAALAGVDPAHRELLLAAGKSEAMLTMTFGLGASVIPLLCTVACAARWITLPRQPQLPLPPA